MTTDVIVVGAGPTGLMTACELASRGVDVQVVDRADGPFAGSRGKGVQPRTLELLDRLGLAGRLVALGRFRLPICRWSEGPDGEPVGTEHDMHPDAHPTPDSPYARTLIVPQWRTEQVLREHLSALGVEVRWGTAVRDVTQDDAGATVVTDAGPLTARWVVGCDGGSSAVRHALGVSFLGETHDQIRMLLGDVVVDGVDRDRWHMWEPFLGLCPLPATDTFALQAAAVDVDGPLDVAAFQGVLDRAGVGHVRVRDVRWSSRWRLNVRMVDRYRVGRVLLAGDAAHVHSPAGGQGLNTGIGDAANLGWKLAAVCAGAGDALLDTYEAERLPIAAGVLGLSTKLLDRPFEQRGADAVTTMQLGLGYRGGPLVAGDDRRAGSDAGAGSGSGGTGTGSSGTGSSGTGSSGTGSSGTGSSGTGSSGTGTGSTGSTGSNGGGEASGPRPGDRAPDAPLRDADGRRVRLFDQFRHVDWTLIGYGTVPEPRPGVRAVAVGPADGTGIGAAEQDGDAGLRDRHGHFADAYAAEPGELVLVRPDGYVAIRTTDPDVVDGYLSGTGAVPAAASPGAVA